jgi:hypothetical protein
MDELAHQEEDLYPAIQKLMERAVRRHLSVQDVPRHGYLGRAQ